MSTYKDIITNCLNNDKVIPPRIRLNIYNKIYFPEFDRNLIFKNTNLFILIKHSGTSWFYYMDDRIAFVKFMIDIVSKEIDNNKRNKKKVKE